MEIVFGEETDKQFDHTQLWRELNQTSDKILNFLREGRYEEANELLNYFSEQFLQIRAADYHLTMRELQVITTTFEEVREATVNISMAGKERIKRGTKLRLLVDVYDESIEPLWKKTKETVITPLKKMEMAIEEDNIQQFRDELSNFIEQYEMVRPAWSVGLPIVTYQQADAQVQYLLQIQRNPVSKKELLAHLFLMEKHFTNIYEGVEDDTSDPQVIWVILTIGGAIVLALSYTAWKKYRAEKQQEKIERQKRRRLY